MSIHEKRVRSLRHVWRMFVYTFYILVILGAAETMKGRAE